MRGLKALSYGFMITLSVLIVQLVGYYLSGSLALLSDSGHVFSDLVALGASLTALYFASLAPSNRQTFGFHRMEVLAAFFNGFLLLLMAILIVQEALERWENVRKIEPFSLLATASFGLLGNLYVVYLLHTHKNLSVRSAFLHAMGDALSSVGVITSAFIILFTGMYEVDVLVSIGIAILITISAYRLLRKSGAMLLDRAPKELAVDEIKRRVKQLKEVKDVHDVHVWRACSDLTFATLHIVVSEKSVKEAVEVRHKVEEILKDMNVAHTTIQIDKEGTKCAVEKGCSVRTSH